MQADIHALTIGAVGLLLAACGGDDGPSADGDATTEVGESSATTDRDASTTHTDPGDPTTAGSSESGSGASLPDTDGASSDGTGGPATPDGIPIFVAQGMVGRTTISCDDGLTWVADRSWDLEGDPHLCGSSEPVSCFTEGSSCSQVWFDGTCSTGPCDCGHSPGFSKGVAWGGGVFVATWGWGWPGAVATSENGVDWETTLDNDTFGGLRYGAGRFVVASRTPFTSADGLSWEPSEEADFQSDTGETIWSVRRFGVSDYDGGRFIAYASGEGTDVLVSSDAGVSWWRPSVLPDDCLGEGPGAYGDIVSGGGVILMVDGDGHACRSVDGGDTWTTNIIGPERVASSGVWTGEEFWFWGFGNRYSSPDGVTWETTPVQADAAIGPVARSPEGTLVAVDNVWVGYDEQRFLRSEDGLSWQVLPDGAYTGSHPIFFIEHGFAAPSDACPG
jgi:hypothetical protein